MSSALAVTHRGEGAVSQEIATRNASEGVPDPLVKRVEDLEAANKTLREQNNTSANEKAGLQSRVDELTVKLKSADERIANLERDRQTAQKTQSVGDKLILRKRAKVSTCFRECMKAYGGSDAIPMQGAVGVAFGATAFFERWWIKAGVAVAVIAGTKIINWWIYNPSSAICPHLEEARDICAELEIPWRPLDQDPSPPEGKQFFTAWKAVRAENPALDRFFVNDRLPSELTSIATSTPTAAPRRT